MTYQPRPIDTTHVVLSSDVEGLTELLAKNTHENWAAQRIRDGWRHGPTRDDAKKEHPCLVPYGQLPEAEKEYDRRTTMETVKAMLALGYRVVR